MKPEEHHISGGPYLGETHGRRHSSEAKAKDLLLGVGSTGNYEENHAQSNILIDFPLLALKGIYGIPCLMCFCAFQWGLSKWQLIGNWTSDHLVSGQASPNMARVSFLVSL